jgi:hypothetical protein
MIKVSRRIIIRRLVSALIAVVFTVMASGCEKTIAPFSVAQVDRTVGPTTYPLAVDPSRVGLFGGNTKSGGGYFYDEVLEYRVWLDPERGAQRRAGNADYFAAFARYESALEFSRRNAGADEPLVLVRQCESINEPTPGTFFWEKSERITEWKVPWLEGAKRTPRSIPEFLAAHGAGSE